MVYVQRDALDKVVGVFANPQPGYAEEELDDDNSEVVAFRQKVAAAFGVPTEEIADADVVTTPNPPKST